MTPEQCRMARAALKWSLTDLSLAAKVGRATAARFELGEQVNDSSIATMRQAFEHAGVQFTRRASRIGVSVPES